MQTARHQNRHQQLLVAGQSSYVQLKAIPQVPPGTTPRTWHAVAELEHGVRQRQQQRQQLPGGCRAEHLCRRRRRARHHPHGQLLLQRAILCLQRVCCCADDCCRLAGAVCRHLHGKQLKLLTPYQEPSCIDSSDNATQTRVGASMLLKAAV